MQFAVARGAEGNPFFPASVFRGRLLFPADPTDVSYVLVTPFNDRVERSFPGVSELMDLFASWPKAFQQGEIEVLRNPQLQVAGEEALNGP